MLTVIGEAVVDLVAGNDGRYTAHPGGSPLNVAVGLARLGVPTRLGARFARSRLGRGLREHAANAGVDLSLAIDADEPASLAVVALNPDGTADYDFYLDGTADWQWTSEELAPLTVGSPVLHTGSLACFLQPGGAAVARAMRAARAAGALVSFDPNIRPRLLGSAASARERVEALAAEAHLVKASSEDLAWLYPGESAQAVARRWLELGPRVVSITLGAAGALAASGEQLLQRAAPGLTVVDTVGAGDAFMAGLLAALVHAGSASPASLAHLGGVDLAAAVDEAIAVATITCTRAGADPPTRAEVIAWRDRYGAVGTPPQSDGLEL